MISNLSLIFRYQIIAAWRHSAELINPLLFFIIAISLFPLAISPDPQLLQKIAPGIIWIISLLSILIAQERLFERDYYEGSLEQLILNPQPLSLFIFMKLLAYWLLSSVPLIMITPLLALSLNLSAHALAVLIWSLLLGTPTLVFLGAIGRALTLGLRQGHLLMILLILPFYIPVLIFGASAVIFAEQGMSATGQLAWLAVLLILTLLLTPLAIIAALKVRLSES